MALSPPTERVLRACLAVQITALEWEASQRVLVNNQARSEKGTLKAMKMAIETLEEAHATMSRITHGAQG